MVTHLDGWPGWLNAFSRSSRAPFFFFSFLTSESTAFSAHFSSSSPKLSIVNCQLLCNFLFSTWRRNIKNSKRLLVQRKKSYLKFHDVLNAEILKKNHMTYLLTCVKQWIIIFTRVGIPDVSVKAPVFYVTLTIALHFFCSIPIHYSIRICYRG